MVNINDVLNAAIKFTLYHINSRTNRFYLTLSDDIPEIFGKKQVLEHVFITLILTSCQAITSRDQSFTITTQFIDDLKYVEISFMDGGSGIEEENINQDFLPSSSRSSIGQKVDFEKENTKKVIREHDGEIEFNSTIDNSRIINIRLPIHELDNIKNA
ncbi:MAG: hypothetical protein COA73_02190 [Candidatus Hydrogenedentota bacterium]|nr:MAG: hypothetical protein COA73_02190 [Candidatus Hydrogenedentota bacterium]